MEKKHEIWMNEDKRNVLEIIIYIINKEVENNLEDLLKGKKEEVKNKKKIEA